MTFNSLSFHSEKKESTQQSTIPLVKLIKITCHLLWDKHPGQTENSCLSKWNHEDRMPPVLIWLKTAGERTPVIRVPWSCDSGSSPAAHWRERGSQFRTSPCAVYDLPLPSRTVPWNESLYKLIVQYRWEVSRPFLSSSRKGMCISGNEWPISLKGQVSTVKAKN